MKTDKLQEIFGGAKNDVEHGLSMYVDSFFTLPASLIYEKDILKKYEEIIKRCHIYFIGYLPKIHINEIIQITETITLKLQIGNSLREVSFSIPKGCTLIEENGEFFIYKENDEKRIITLEDVSKLASSHVNLNVKYIGQAYGKGGSRNAIDRLLKHETLQKISLKEEAPENHNLHLLLLEVKDNNQLVTLFNPLATNQDEQGTRLKAGLDKLLDTSKQERIALFEASFIKYFKPHFNKEFKDSFPSTNLKILQDCYDKDFSAVFAEISHEDIPFQIGSDTVKASNYHCATHHLHDDKTRSSFFFGE